MGKRFLLQIRRTNSSNSSVNSNSPSSHHSKRHRKRSTNNHLNIHLNNNSPSGNPHMKCIVNVAALTCVPHQASNERPTHRIL